MADDYNFIAGQYNVSRAITKHLATKRLPKAYVDYMTNYYAKMIVRDGKDMNYMAVCELIDRIPEGGEAVWTGEKSAAKGLRTAEGTDLKAIGGARPSRTRHAGQGCPKTGLQTHHGRQSVGDVQKHPQQKDQDPHRLLHREGQQRGSDPEFKADSKKFPDKKL